MKSTGGKKRHGKGTSAPGAPADGKIESSKRKFAQIDALPAGTKNKKPSGKTKTGLG
jgi:hypothetical protein